MNGFSKEWEPADAAARNPDIARTSAAAPVLTCAIPRFSCGLGSDNTAAAVAELGLFDEQAIITWKKSRRAAASCLIGHTDSLARSAA